MALPVASPTMSRSDREATASDVLDAWYAAWNAQDADAVSALLTGDVAYEDGSAPQPVMYGRGAVTAWAQTVFRGLPDLQLEKLEEWVSPGGGVIASYFRLTATFSEPLAPPGRPELAPTGGTIAALGMDRSEIRDRLLARHQIFYDTAEVGRQVGFLPPRGSVAERAAFGVQRLAARRSRRPG